MHRSHTNTAPRDAADIRRGAQRALVALLGLGLLHAWAAWSYPGAYYAEHGRWLHAVERAAAGESPYLDFQYQFPPLALWILGGGARLFGAGYAAIASMALVFYFGVLLAFYSVVRRLVPELAFAVIMAALPFAAAYAWRSGVPLSLGTQAPGVMLGFIGMVVSLHGVLRLLSAPTVAAGVQAGAGAALTLLGTQGFWLAALVLGVAGLAIALRAGPAGHRVAWAVAGSAAAALVIGLGPAVARSPDLLVAMATDFGQLPEVAARAAPALERLVVEVTTLAAMSLTATTALWLCLAIPDDKAARWAGVSLVVLLAAGSVHLGMSVAIGSDLVSVGAPPVRTVVQDLLLASLASGDSMTGAALAVLDQRIQAHLFPATLPAVLLVVVLVRWRHWADPEARVQVAVLLALALAARARRGFAGADWYNVLLELPAYALLFRLYAADVSRQRLGRAVLSVLAVQMLLGLYLYMSVGRGPLTFAPRMAEVTTARGTVRWHPRLARDLFVIDSALSRLDPERRRPVLALGATGGWNYYLGRPNPTRLVSGLHLERGNADSAMAALLRHQPAPLLIDHRFLQGSAPAGLPMPWQWEARPAPGPFDTFDAPRFRAATARCRQALVADSLLMVMVFDCALPPDSATGDTTRAQATR